MKRLHSDGKLDKQELEQGHPDVGLLDEDEEVDDPPEQWSLGKSACTMLESFWLYARWQVSEDRARLGNMGGKRVIADAAAYLALQADLRKYRDRREEHRVPLVEAAYNGHERVCRWLGLVALRWGLPVVRRRSYIRPIRTPPGSLAPLLDPNVFAIVLEQARLIAMQPSLRHS